MTAAPATSATVTTRPGTEIVPDVEVFSTNEYTFRLSDGSTRLFTFADPQLDEIHRNFHELYDGAPNGTRLRPILTLRHQRDKGITEEDPRCQGVVAKDLRRVGNKLVASFADVPRATRAMIARGEIRHVSAEIKPAFTDRGRDFGNVLYRVALLGNEQPRDKGIAPLPFSDDPEGPLDVVLCFADPAPIPEAAVTTAAEPIPAPAPADVAKVRQDLLAFADEEKAKIRQDLLAFADEEKAAIKRHLDEAKASAAATAQLERDRLDREKRQKITLFLSESGVGRPDETGRVIVMPCQRAFFEDSLVREDAVTNLTFADGDKQVQGTALDRKMAEIRKFPPQLDFSERPFPAGPDATGGGPPSDAERTRILSLTPMGRGIIEREKKALPAAAAAK